MYKKIYILSLIPLIGIVLLTGGCKKNGNDTPLQYPIVFYADRLVATSDFRLLTSLGEVPVTDEYRAMAEASPIFDENNWSGMGEAYVQFNTDQLALFDQEGGGEFTIEQSNGRFLFTSVRNVPIPIANSDLHLFLANIPKHRYPITVVPPSTWGLRYSTREMRVAYGDLKELRIPILVYDFARPQEYGSWSAVQRIHNELDEQVVESLQGNDFLLVKQYELVCKTVR